jgi:glycosyltransferase involved in cell wall biosynthesis
MSNPENNSRSSGITIAEAEHLTIAIGIPTYNRAPVLLETLEGIRRLNPAPDEILVVDQSDWYPDATKERLEALAKAGVIRYFRQDTPNLPKARNRVLRETACDVVVFIDDDVELPPSFIAAHALNFRDGTVWAVCGGLTERDIPVRPSVDRTWPKVLDYKLFDPGWIMRVDDFGNVKGGNHSVRRAIALELGGYDEGYSGVALREETDLAFRIIKARGRIVFDPNARLHHLRAPAGGCRVGVWGDWSAGLSVLRFAVRHREALGRHFPRELWRAYRLAVVNRRTVQQPIEMLRRSLSFGLTLIKSLRHAQPIENSEASSSISC